MALALVNNNNNNQVNHLQNNCDCCGVFNNSSDLLTAKIRLSTNNDDTPVLLTKAQLEMLQRDLARIPQLQQSLNNKEIQVINLENNGYISKQYNKHSYLKYRCIRTTKSGINQSKSRS